MGGGGTETQTTTSGLNNPALNTAVSTIGTQLNSHLGQGVRPFTQSMYPGLSTQTTSGANALVNNPANANYSTGIGNTINEFGAIASGQRMGGNDAAWADIKDQAATDVNAVLQGSGRFGSATHRGQLGSAFAGLDLQRQQANEARQMSAAGMLPGLYQGSMLPAQAQLAAGQIMDADLLARRQGEADLFDRTQNQGWNTLARATGILAGTAPSAGTTSSVTTPTAPWWQQAMGYVAGNAGRAMGSF